MRTLLYYFFNFSGVQAEFILDYWNSSDDFWNIAFDRSDRLSRLRAFPYDHFKIYTIIPISPDITELYPNDRGRLSIVRVVCDPPGSVSIWSSRASEQYLRWLGRSWWSGRSMETRLRQTIPVEGRCGRCQGLRDRLYLCFLSSRIASDILSESCIFNNISTQEPIS